MKTFLLITHRGGQTCWAYIELSKKLFGHASTHKYDFVYITDKLNWLDNDDIVTIHRGLVSDNFPPRDGIG